MPSLGHQVPRDGHVPLSPTLRVGCAYPYGVGGSAFGLPARPVGPSGWVELSDTTGNPLKNYTEI